jgi:8-oxo-dGTP pyrophosphatase MutT (NUDIX family)
VAGHPISGEDRRRATAGLRSAREALDKRSHLPAAAYYRRAARHIAAAGALFHDDQHRVLLVQPRHRPTRWQLPGGATEHDEDPYDTARREVDEETGLTLPTTAALLAVDWVPADPTQDRPPLAVYVFDGGHLDPNDARGRIRLQTDELLDWRYAAADEWPGLLATHSERRLHACIEALRSGRAVYLHFGWPPGTSREAPPNSL